MERPTFQRQHTDYDRPDSSSKGAVELVDFGKGEKDGVIVDERSAELSPSPTYDKDNEGFGVITEPVHTAEDLVTQVIHVEDDPTISAVTFRTFFLGMTLSIP